MSASATQGGHDERMNLVFTALNILTSQVVDRQAYRPIGSLLSLILTVLAGTALVRGDTATDLRMCSQ